MKSPKHLDRSTVPDGLDPKRAVRAIKLGARPSASERFHRAYIVDTVTGCWIWQRWIRHGYGAISVNDKSIRAHRFSWELFRGPIPCGLCVLHKCDVPRCVNPDHLVLGTQQENMSDRCKKGRTICGEAHYKAKLTDSQILLIRSDDRTNKLIANDYGVTNALVSRIRLRQIWKHVFPTPRERGKA